MSSITEAKVFVNVIHQIYITLERNELCVSVAI